MTDKQPTQFELVSYRGETFGPYASVAEAVEAAKLTHERLKQLLAYDPATGLFRWNVATNGFVKVGDIAGTTTKIGYVEIQVDKQAYRAQNLAWFYVTGAWPKMEVDHRDTNKANNSWLNLREATRQQQCTNQPTRRDNKLGVKGVCPYRDGRRYVAQIRLNGKTKHLGLFDTVQEAALAYETAAVAAWGEFARTA